jgi:protein-tyrosine phosphatase
MPTGFHIVFVCTGNICRSPMAERLARAAFGSRSPLRATSAGTRAEPGLEMTPHARRVLAGLGGDAAGFTSRTLTADLVAAADLVLTATTQHRAESVALHPPAAGLAFTIVEFGALAKEVAVGEIACHRDPVRRAQTLVEQVRGLRGLVRVDQPDIADPYGGSLRAYRVAGRRIAESLAVPARLLTPSP